MLKCSADALASGTQDITVSPPENLQLGASYELVEIPINQRRPLSSMMKFLRVKDEQVTCVLVFAEHAMHCAGPISELQKTTSKRFSFPRGRSYMIRVPFDDRVCYFLKGAGKSQHLSCIVIQETKTPY